MCRSLFFKPATLFKKEALAQVFSCEFYEISKNAFFHRTPLVAASGYYFCQTEKSRFFYYFLWDNVKKTLLLLNIIE